MRAMSRLFPPPMPLLPFTMKHSPPIMRFASYLIRLSSNNCRMRFSRDSSYAIACGCAGFQSKYLPEICLSMPLEDGHGNLPLNWRESLKAEATHTSPQTLMHAEGVHGRDPDRPLHHGEQHREVAH